MMPVTPDSLDSAADATAVAAAVDAADMGPVRVYIAAAQAADFKIDEQVKGQSSRGYAN
jgi:hypothetical protein